jgi:exosome complex RNA-binding protein Rrp4
MLSAVSLPGGVQRRRTAEDELQMREIFQEGDLISVCILILFLERNKIRL